MADLPISSALAAQSVSAGAGQPPVRGRTPEDARKAGEEFEAFFLTQMLEHMFKGIPTDGYFGGGYGEGVYRSVMLQEYGRVLSKAGGVGIGDMVGRELIKLQETKQ
jgi:Rod binding domain-containing protein